MFQSLILPLLTRLVWTWPKKNFVMKVLGIYVSRKSSPPVGPVTVYLNRSILFVCKWLYASWCLKSPSEGFCVSITTVTICNHCNYTANCSKQYFIHMPNGKISKAIIPVLIRQLQINNTSLCVSMQLNKKCYLVNYSITTQILEQKGLWPLEVRVWDRPMESSGVEVVISREWWDRGRRGGRGFSWKTDQCRLLMPWDLLWLLLLLLLGLCMSLY